MKPRKERIDGLGSRPITAPLAREIRDEPSALDEPGKKTLVCEIVAGQHVYRRGLWCRVRASRPRGMMGWCLVLAPARPGELQTEIRCPAEQTYFVKLRKRP